MVDNTPTGEESKNPAKTSQGKDQTQHNVPIDIEHEEMMDLLDKKMQDLKLDGKESDILREGLKQDSFYKAANEVAESLKKRNKYA